MEGVKISLKVLSDIADDLPPPASSVVNLVQRIIDTAEVSACIPRCKVLSLIANRPLSGRSRERR